MASLIVHCDFGAQEKKICHCFNFFPLLFAMKWSESRSVVSNSLRPHGLYSPWNSPGQNTGMGSLSLFQGIFPTQGSNPGLPHCRHILYQLSHQGSPRILEWVAYPFSSRSSWPRNWTWSPALQVDSLPTEIAEKPKFCLIDLLTDGSFLPLDPNHILIW